MVVSVRLKNQFKGDNFDFDIKNVNLNGRKIGCSGFIKNPDNGCYVYVSTDCIVGPLRGQLMYRFAKDYSDYTGGINHFCKSLDDYVSKIRYALNHPELSEAE